MEVFVNLKNLFLSVWDKGILGIDIGQILIGLGIFLIFLIFRGLISKLIIKKLELISKRTTNKLDVGIVGNSDLYIDNAEVGTAGTVALGATAICTQWKNVGTSDVRIAAKYIPSGTAASAGKARVCIVYAQARNHTD